MNQISIKKLYDAKFRGDITLDNQKSGVPIGNSGMNKKVSFRTEAPLINITKRDIIVVVRVFWHQPFTV